MNKVALLLLILTLTIFAQQEAGDYDRPSLTYIDRLLQIDNSISDLPSKYNSMLVKRMGTKLKLPRYDYNPIPRKLHDQFGKEVIATERKCAGDRENCLIEVTNLINRVIAPPILDVVEMNRDLRAQERMTEQQRNSFIKDKAKELGFTEDEVKRVMNSAYVFMPLASDFKERTWKDTTYYMKEVVRKDGTKYKIRTNKIKKITTYLNSSMKMGLAWWKIEPGDSTRPSRLQGYEPLTDSGQFTVDLAKTYMLNSKPMKAREYARTKLILSLGGDFGSRLKAFEAFKLSGQVLDRNAGFVGIDIGAREGISVDDVFWVMEQREEGGKTVVEKGGWVMVRDVADSGSTNGYKSKAQAIGGRPYIGAVLKEQPMMDLESALRFQKFIYNTTKDAGENSILRDLDLSDAYGGRLELMGPIGRSKGISQLYFVLGGSFSLGSASGRISHYDTIPVLVPDPENPDDTTIIVEDTLHNITDVAAGHYDISIMKRFYAKRVAFTLQTGFGYQHLNIKMDDMPGAADLLDTVDYNYHLKTSQWGGFSNAFIEVAVTPGFAFGGGVGYRYFGSNNDFEYRKRLNEDDADWEVAEQIDAGPTVNYNGMTWSAYMTFRPSINLRR